MTTLRDLSIGIARAKSAAILAPLAHGVGAAIRHTVTGGATVGEHLARGLGASPALGAFVGGAIPVAAGLTAAQQSKRKFDMWRLQNGLIDPNSFYG